MDSRRKDLWETFAVRTASGKIHLTTRLNVEGMCSGVPRTLCSSMIRSCSAPEPISNPENNTAICEHCLEVYEGSIFDPEIRAAAGIR